MAASQSGLASSPLDTFPRLLLNHAAVRGDRPATREKYLGIWQTWNWSQVAQEVRAMACGLAELGFKRGDNLALIGDNRPRLYWAMCAAQMLGGVALPLYQDAVAAEMVFVLQDAEVRFAGGGFRCAADDRTVGAHHPPHIAHGLAQHVAGIDILVPVIERPAVGRHLVCPIRAFGDA